MKKFCIADILLRFFQGLIVGFGAIMPGISGGTLCVAFGMYKPLIELISHPKQNFRNYWKNLLFFGLGAAVGFIGLADVAAYLLDKNTALMICAFIGFIIGTFPELWQDAGKEKRNKKSYIALILGFILMLIILLFIKGQISFTVEANIFGYLFCGLLWGLSFIVPGLSSSTLLIFFGLYQPMLEGISSFSLAVLIPLLIGMSICVLALSKLINLAFSRFYSVISHAIVGIVAATTVMIFPFSDVKNENVILYIICIAGGAAVSYILTRICGKLKEKSIEE